MHNELSSYTTTAEHILNEIQYGSHGPDTLPNDLERSKALLIGWIYSSTKAMLSNFVRCITGRSAPIKGKKIRVLSLSCYADYQVIFKPEPAHDTRAVGNDIEYLSPKFSTCGSQIQLAIWPIEKTSEDFNGLMDASIEACRDGTFTMR